MAVGSGGPLGKGGLAQLWVAAGGNPAKANLAASIALAESSGMQHSTNHNTNGTTDRGYWQINSVHGGQSTYDPLGNVKAAIAISDNGRNFSPWTTYNTGAYKQFLGQKIGNPGTALPTMPGSSSSTTGAGFNQAGYQAALAKSIAGNYVSGSIKQANDPYSAGQPSTGITAAQINAPLLSSGALTTATPNMADYAQAQSKLQDLSGGAPLNQHPAAFNVALGKSGYTNPLPTVTHWERTDQGVDASLPVGAPIRAIGDAKVMGIEPNWYNGQPLVYYKLLSGPDAGHYVYVAEQITDIAKPGSIVRAGGTIARYAGSGTGIEMGWATASGQTQAMATTGYKEGYATASGRNFRNFLDGLGARAGQGKGLSIGAGADPDDDAAALAAQGRAVRNQRR